MPLGIGAGLFAGAGQGLALAQQQAQQQQLNNLRIKQAQEEQAVAALLGKTNLSQLGGQSPLAQLPQAGGQMTPAMSLLGGGQPQVTPPVAAQPTTQPARDPGGGTNTGYIPLDADSPPVAGLPLIQPGGGQIPRDTSRVPIVGLPAPGDSPSMAGPQPVPSDATSTPEQASPPKPAPAAAAAPSAPPPTPSQAPATPAPIQKAMDDNNISMGKDGVPVLDFGGYQMPITDLIPKHVSLGDIQQAIMRSNPGADPGAVGLATLKLFDAVNRGATQDRQMASLILQSLSRSGNLQLGQQKLQETQRYHTGTLGQGQQRIEQGQQRIGQGQQRIEETGRHHQETEGQGRQRIQQGDVRNQLKQEQIAIQRARALMTSGDKAIAAQAAAIMAQRRTITDRAKSDPTHMITDADAKALEALDQKLEQLAQSKAQQYQPQQPQQ